MPLVDLATFNSFRQFPGRHSLVRQNVLIVFFLAGGLSFSEGERGAVKRVFEEVASRNEKIGLLEAMVGVDSVHVFACLRATVSPAEAADFLKSESEESVSKKIPRFAKPVWKNDCALHSVGAVSKVELDACRERVCPKKEL